MQDHLMPGMEKLYESIVQRCCPEKLAPAFTTRQFRHRIPRPPMADLGIPIGTPIKPDKEDQAEDVPQGRSPGRFQPTAHDTRRRPVPPEHGITKLQRTTTEQMYDSQLRDSIDNSINKFEMFSSEFQDQDVRETRRILIRALRNFHQAYIYWILPNVGSGSHNMTAALERSSDNSPFILDSDRRDGLKWGNRAERGDSDKFRKGSSGRRLSEIE